MGEAAVSRKPVYTVNQDEQKRVRKVIRLTQNNSIKEKLLKEFSCLICGKVLASPLTTPCAHNFCKSCLLGSYAEKSFVRERTCADGRMLRARKIIKKCPVCPSDISDFLQNPQVNRELMGLIVSLQSKNENVEDDNEENDDAKQLSEVCDVEVIKSCQIDDNKEKPCVDVSNFSQKNSNEDSDAMADRNVNEKEPHTEDKRDSSTDDIIGKAVGEETKIQVAVGAKRPSLVTYKKAVKRSKPNTAIVHGDGCISSPSIALP